MQVILARLSKGGLDFKLFYSLNVGFLITCFNRTSKDLNTANNPYIASIK